MQETLSQPSTNRARNKKGKIKNWIPAFARMTRRKKELLLRQIRIAMTERNKGSCMKRFWVIGFLALAFADCRSVVSHYGVNMNQKLLANGVGTTCDLDPPQGYEGKNIILWNATITTTTLLPNGEKFTPLETQSDELFWSVERISFLYYASNGVNHNLYSYSNSLIFQTLY